MGARRSALASTIIFLIFGKRLNVSLIDYVLEDYYFDQVDLGRVFSIYELEEIDRMRSQNYFLEGGLFHEVKRYILPFLKHF